jgi:hypothetical protein
MTEWETPRETKTASKGEFTLWVTEVKFMERLWK